MTNWYVYVDAREHGPLSTEDANRLVRAEAAVKVRVWRAGFEDWKLPGETVEFNTEPPPLPLLIPERMEG